MKKSISTKFATATILAVSLSCAAPAIASSKLKPLEASAQIEVVWYQPVLDFFGF